MKMQHAEMRQRVSLSIALGFVAIAIAACGSSTTGGPSSATRGSTASPTSTSGASPVATDPSVRALVPASLKAKGVLTAGAEIDYPPAEYFAGTTQTPTGFDIDLTRAVLAAMGLRARFVNTTFQSLIPGVASGKYDLVASYVNDTKARENAVTFVDYIAAGSSLMTLANGGTTISGIGDLCGHSVAVQQGGTEQASAEAQSNTCRKEGRPPVEISVFGDANSMNLALSTGRVQLVFADTPVVGYIVQKSSGRFKIVGQPVDVLPVGFLISKSNDGLARAVLAALSVLMRDGTYKSILAKYGAQNLAISHPVINGAKR
jgi:polar amino acid transport system substrate-binding protein